MVNSFNGNEILCMPFWQPIIKKSDAAKKHCKELSELVLIKRINIIHKTKAKL